MSLAVAPWDDVETAHCLSYWNRIKSSYIVDPEATKSMAPYRFRFLLHGKEESCFTRRVSMCDGARS